MKAENLFVLFSYVTGCAALAKPNLVREVDVAIVGGGATGAYAAVRLREDYGKSVLVIEKEDKLVSNNFSELSAILTSLSRVVMFMHTSQAPMIDPLITASRHT